MENEPSPFGYNLAKVLVLNKIKSELGLDRCTQLYVGAAPCSKQIKEYFMSLGMPLINTYGLSETSGPTTHMNSAESGNFSFDKAGRAFPGTEIKIYNPDE